MSNFEEPQSSEVPEQRDQKIVESVSENQAERREQIRNAVDGKAAALMERLHPKESWAFHNTEHPEHVREDAEAVLNIFAKHTALVTQEKRMATKSAIEGHDTIISTTEVTDPKAFNYGELVRHRGFGDTMPPSVRKIFESIAAHGQADVSSGKGKKLSEQNAEELALIPQGNEYLSWLALKEIIDEEDLNHEVYTPEVMRDIEKGIATTYPDVALVPVAEAATRIMNPETNQEVDITKYIANKTGEREIWQFTQPLGDVDNLVAFGVGSGDLDYVGACESEVFRMRGNGEFREIQALLGRGIAGGIDQMSVENKIRFANRALNWMKSQVGFVLGRKIDFEAKLNKSTIVNQAEDPLTGRNPLKDELNQRYNMFDANILASAERYDGGDGNGGALTRFGTLTKAETYTEANADELFRELVREMGYETE